jgi:hypothetical protein
MGFSAMTSLRRCLGNVPSEEEIASVKATMERLGNTLADMDKSASGTERAGIGSGVNIQV